MSGSTSERLITELKNDLISRDAMREDNKNLESDIKKWEKELHYLIKENPTNDKITHIDCVAFREYQNQVKKKENLKHQIAENQERLRILREARTDITEMNLDNLTQPEIIRLVKQLERRKIDTQSKLRETENSLDFTAMEAAKLEETYKLYQTEFELRERKRGVTRLQRI